MKLPNWRNGNFAPVAPGYANLAPRDQAGLGLRPGALEAVSHQSRYEVGDKRETGIDAGEQAKFIPVDTEVSGSVHRQKEMRNKQYHRSEEPPQRPAVDDPVCHPASQS